MTEIYVDWNYYIKVAVRIVRVFSLFFVFGGNGLVLHLLSTFRRYIFGSLNKSLRLRNKIKNTDSRHSHYYGNSGI